MADEKDNKKKDTGHMLVADLHVSQIIAALHQNAVEKCKGKLGDKFRIQNSAIDDADGKAVLNSQGQHIISVIPTEEAAKKDITAPFDSALKVLKTYVQWFVGPDLAKKVDKSTVNKLTDKPGKKEVKENTEPFIKFSQFLKEEAEEDEDQRKPNFGIDAQEEDSDTQSKPFFDTGEEDRSVDPDDSNPDFSDGGSKDKDKNSKEEKSEVKKEYDKTSSQIGYYIVYEMKVDGLKKEAKLEDSMKSMGKSIFNFLGNFFDDVTFTGSGLFGGSASFKFKDFKDQLRKTFGPIDPDELVRNVKDRLDKKFNGSSPQAEVKIQDKRTLVADLGSFIDGKQKQQIESADYSLWIKLDTDDPKKQILNRGSIADIVQASITGLYKKFKNRISKNDVIYIPNYKDIHKNTDKLRALYNEVPSPNDLQARIDKSRDVNDAVSKIDRLFDRIIKNKGWKDCERAQKCISLWNKFIEKHKLHDNSQELSKVSGGSRKFKELFQGFFEQYAKVFKSTEDKNLNESAREVCFAVSSKEISKMLLESMFGEHSSLVNEDDASSNEDFSQKDAVTYAKHYIEEVLGDSYFEVTIGPKSQLKDSLKLFNIPSGFDKSEKKNAFAVFPENPSAKKSSSKLSESKIGDDIFSILFEEDADADNEASSSENAEVDESEIEYALKKSLEDAHFQEEMGGFGEFFVLTPKTLHESEDKDKKIQLSKINSLLNSSLKSFVESKVKEQINQSWFIAVARTGNVVEFLKDHSLGSEDDYKKLDKDYAFIFLTYPKSSNKIKTSNGRRMKKCAGTRGYKFFSPDTVKSIIARSVNTKGDFDVFTVTGTPSKAAVNSSIFRDNKKTDTLAYYETDFVPEYKVYLAPLDITSESDSSQSGSEQQQQLQQPLQQKSDSGNASRKTLANAYVLMFGDEELESKSSVDGGDDSEIREISSKEVARNDLYIIPMPGLQYEDPEYANKKLI